MIHAALLLVASTLAAPAEPRPDAIELDRAAVVRAAVARVAPAIVTLETIGGAQPLPAGAATQPTSAPARPGMFAGRAFRVGDGPTTGLLWSADGLVVTSSFNFVRDPSIITVTLADGRRFVGKLLGRDFIRRLALVRIDATDLPLPDWTPAAELEVGRYAIAVGRGYGGPAPSLSLGMISAVGRRSGAAIQCDAKLSPVNYGGPVIDLDGRVLGLAVPLAGGGGDLAGVEWYDSGIGFAITHDRIAASVERMQTGHDLQPGKLGVVLRPGRASDNPSDDDSDDESQPPAAPRIAAIARPSPADSAGLQVNDVVRALGNVPVGDIADLQRRLSDIEAGATITLSIERAGKPLRVRVTLAAPADIGPVAAPDNAAPTSQPASQPAS